MEERIKQLNKNISELKEWMNGLKKVQLPFPSGPVTKQVLGINNLLFTGKTRTAGTFDTSIQVRMDNVFRNSITVWISAQKI